MDIDFEKLLAQSPNPYVVLNQDFVMVWMNDAYLDVTMRTREGLTGRNIFEAFPSDPDSESHRLLETSLERTRSTGKPDEIALIRYDIERPDGGMDVRYWSATHTPLCNEKGEVRFIKQHTVDVTELHELRKLRDGIGVLRRAGAVQEQNRALVEESRTLLEFFEQAPGFTAVLGGHDHRFQMTNAAYRQLVGREDIIGKPVREALPEVVDQGFIDILDQVYTSGEPYIGKRETVVLNADTDGSAITRKLNFIFQPVLADDGETTGIIIQGYDVTEEVEAQERQTLLVNELNHRVKNTLAIVQGLAAQSFRNSQDKETSRRVFEGRLQALASAHNLLTESHWKDASVKEIVCEAASATVGAALDRFEIDGPNVSFPPQDSVSLAMIVHELSTNAMKYGALSNDTGKVAVEWTVEPVEQEEGRIFRLDWVETGGPPVREPTERKGFGSRLIGRGISSGPGSSVKTEFHRDGLRCTIQCRVPQ